MEILALQPFAISYVCEPGLSAMKSKTQIVASNTGEDFKVNLSTILPLTRGIMKYH
jgi:hypothetical protein